MGTIASINAVLITGASSGIGHALAIRLAEPGVTLHLSGRDADRLAAVTEACRALGADVHARIIDVRDEAGMAGWIESVGHLDLVVANAGIAAGAGTGVPETPDMTRAIIATNLDGALSTVLPAMAVMLRQGRNAEGVRGRIAVIASIAAFIATPGAAAYCASKAAIDAWMVATAPAMHPLGLRLCSVCPGFIRTPMTDRNRFWMPGLMEPEDAAERILRGILAERTRVVFPRWMGAMARFSSLLPPALLGWLLREDRG